MQPLRGEDLESLKLHQEWGGRMENMLECVFIVLWLQFGCKLPVKRWELMGTFFQRQGGEREESRHCSSQALCWDFKHCWKESFVLFLCSPEQGCVEKTKWSRVLRPWEPRKGAVSSLNCSHSVSGFRGLQWYRQDPGKGPELLFFTQLGMKSIKKDWEPPC